MGVTDMARDGVREGVGMDECMQRCASGCMCNVTGRGLRLAADSADAPMSIVVLMLLPVLVELLIQMPLLHFAQDSREKLIRRQILQFVMNLWLLLPLPVLRVRER